MPSPVFHGFAVLVWLALVVWDALICGLVIGSTHSLGQACGCGAKLAHDLVTGAAWVFGGLATAQFVLHHFSRRPLFGHDDRLARFPVVHGCSLFLAFCVTNPGAIHLDRALTDQP